MDFKFSIHPDLQKSCQNLTQHFQKFPKLQKLFIFKNEYFILSLGLGSTAAGADDDARAAHVARRRGTRGCSSTSPDALAGSNSGESNQSISGVLKPADILNCPTLAVLSGESPPLRPTLAVLSEESPGERPANNYWPVTL